MHFIMNEEFPLRELVEPLRRILTIRKLLLFQLILLNREEFKLFWAKSAASRIEQR
jgi:hypothetical protein